MTIQIRVACRLAAAHGHEWAWMGEDVAAAAFAVGGAKLIADLTDARREEGALVGIAAPAFQDDGAIVHTTATGRVCWTIGKSGDCGIEILRPGVGNVLFAHVEKNGELLDAFRVDDSGPYGRRHLEALLVAVRAAVPDVQATINLADAMELGLDIDVPEPDVGTVWVGRRELAARLVRRWLEPGLDPAEERAEACSSGFKADEMQVLVASGREAEGQSLWPVAVGRSRFSRRQRSFDEAAMAAFAKIQEHLSWCVSVANFDKLSELEVELAALRSSAQAVSEESDPTGEGFRPLAEKAEAIKRLVERAIAFFGTSPDTDDFDGFRTFLSSEFSQAIEASAVWSTDGSRSRLETKLFGIPFVVEMTHGLDNLKDGSERWFARTPRSAATAPSLGVACEKLAAQVGKVSAESEDAARSYSSFAEALRGVYTLE